LYCFKTIAKRFDGGVNKQFQKDRHLKKKVDQKEHTSPNVESVLLHQYQKQSFKCIYCRIFMRATGSKRLVFDRIDPSLEDIQTNTVLCCDNCLKLKEEDYTHEEFIHLRSDAYK